VLYFRFGAALLLIVSVALAGTALETQCLTLKRSLSQQQYRRDVLRETQVRLRLETQKLGAPARLMEALQRGDSAWRRPPDASRAADRRSPLLNWTQQPATQRR